MERIIGDYCVELCEVSKTVTIRHKETASSSKGKILELFQAVGSDVVSVYARNNVAGVVVSAGREALNVALEMLKGDVSAEPEKENISA